MKKIAKKVTKKIAKAEARKPAKKTGGKPARKTAKGVSTKTKRLLSSVSRKFAKANGLTLTNATVMIIGCLAISAINHALDDEIMAGRKVKARRADKKTLDDLAKKYYDNERFRSLKVKPADIQEMDKLMKAFDKEVNPIDFSGM